MLGSLWFNSFSSGAPASDPAYELIATLSGGATSINFTSIPGTYKHLQLRAVISGDNFLNNIGLRFNSDTASNYSGHYLGGSNGSVASANTTSWMSGAIFFGYHSTSYGTNALYPSITDILNYANTATYKTTRTLLGESRPSSIYSGINLYSGNWRNTSAITSLSIVNDYGATFPTSSRFSLYGLKG